MFTGLIEETALVEAQGGGTLRVKKPKIFDDLKLGSSIAVNGVCLTVSDLTEREMEFDLSPETLYVTTLGTLKTGDLVNLERPLPMHGRLDGHVVQGHIEGVASVEDLHHGELWIDLPPELSKSVIYKGSITVDGVSLTVAAKKGNRIRMALIPETLVRTTLGNLKNGNRVNIETDMIGKYVAAFVKQS